MARRIQVVALLLALALLPAAHASEFASGQLNIAGLTLEVDTKPHQTGADIPGVVQTIFGGKTGDAAPPTTMVAAADLIGPGLDAPIVIRTQPGRVFVLPPLHQQGTYTLLNIRLVDAKGNFVQPAVPASTTIDVVGTLSTEVNVQQLTADDLRARGINVDPSNYDAYDYNFLFAVQGVNVQVPYTVLIDKRTHEVIVPATGGMGGLPAPPTLGAPPRWDPPQVIGLTLFDDDLTFEGGDDNEGDPGTEFLPKKRRPTIPAAVVIPTGFGVLHQFFSVILNVSNAAPKDSQIRLDSITATFTAPNGMRISKVMPAVAIGQPVPIYDQKSGATLLVAQAQGSAEWTLEALRAGTQTVDLDIRATYKAPDQADVPLKGHVSASIVVNDPRFQINFVHPDNVRAGESYTAYAFITNVSPSTQNVKVDLSSIRLCSEGTNNNICRVDGDAVRDLSIPPGVTVPVPYHLKPTITGHFYAAVPDAPDGVSTTITLQMGVDANGIPLSPATIVMPWYTQYVNSDFVGSQMPLIGIAYSLATAPMVPALSSFPKLIRTDVFTRAQDIARAGQRIFVARANPAADNVAEDRDPIFHLALDLLGNVERIDRVPFTADMHEWDQVREKISDGRIAEAGMARELERVGLANGKRMTDFAADFAAATSHRSPYFLALAHGATVSGSARPYALTVTGATSKASIAARAEDSGAPATLPYAQLTGFNSTSEAGELALVGRWNESMTVSVVSASSSFTLDLIYPGAADGSFIRNSLAITGATAGPVTVTVERGNQNLIVTGAVGTPSVGAVGQTPLAVVHAAQDLHLDDKGHIVTVLFNRPVKVDNAAALRDLVTLVTSLPSAGVPEITKKNKPSDPSAQLVIPGAALQDDGRLLNLSFDHSLTTKAQYKIGLDPLADALVPGMGYTSSPPSIVPRIDNNAPGGSIVGKLLRGDNTPVGGAAVQIQSTGLQYDVTQSDGSFLFEFIARDIDKNLPGNYKIIAQAEGKTTELAAAIHTDGEIQRIVLQFLGRGSVTGVAKYSDGTPLAKKIVAVTSPVFFEYHGVLTHDDGSFRVDDLPVGPVSMAVLDGIGNAAYATNQIRTPNEVIVQDLVVEKQPFAGVATIRVTVKRSDRTSDPDPRKALVAGAHVGVSTAGVGLLDGFTDVNGQITFQKVPAGFVSVFAAEFGITRSQAADDFPLTADTTVDKVLVLPVPTHNDAVCTLQGDVTRDDPTNPASPTRYPVPGAILSIKGMAPITADDRGHFVVNDLPVVASGSKVLVYDPALRRSALAGVPALRANDTNDLPIEMLTTHATGHAKLILRLLSATGQPVTDYFVNLPGYPAIVFDNKFDGTYELTVAVPRKVDVWALPGKTTAFRHHLYGYQTAHISMFAGFDGQDVHADLHLPGQGSVNGKILQLKRCPDGVTSCEPQYDIAHGNVGVSHLMWDEPDQTLKWQDRIPVESDEHTGIATTDMVPVGSATAETIDHPAGYASVDVAIRFEGDSVPAELIIKTLGTVTGRVFNWDGQTPVAGASLTLFGDFATMPDFRSGPDGTFSFPSVAANSKFRIVAKVTLNGIERWGYVDGKTPLGGGPVGPLNLIMRRQANVSGTIVDANNAPVPLARYWIRELGWPNRTFGSETDPLYADKNGAFFLNNLFVGGVRITAEDPVVQEDRGDLSAVIKDEGDDQKNLVVQLGSVGRSIIRVTVLDPNNAYAVVPNAEVTLIGRPGVAFDFASTNANGVAEFDQVPISGNYSSWTVVAVSKSLGRGGSVGGITLTNGVPKDIQVPLTMTGIVSGTVVESVTSDAPVPGAAVNLIGPANEWASTDGAGAYIFNGVPEGTFRLDGVDLRTGRHTVPLQNPLTISSLFPEQRGIKLPLEATASLTVNVYLPDDAGHSSGVFAPQANLHLRPTGEAFRELQAIGGPVTFTNVIAKPYLLDIFEIGGLGRELHYNGTFPAGAASQSLDFVLAAFGEVDVKVTGEPSQIANAQVSIASGRQAWTVYTDTAGMARLQGIPLGPFTVQVRSQTLGLSAGTNGELTSQSHPANVELALGRFVTVHGNVDAEQGGVSANTRVTASFSSGGKTFIFEAQTDAGGYYSFVGIPSNISLGPVNFYAADGTLGAHKDNIAVGATDVEIPRVRLDSTPPRVISIDPANNANAVAPNAHIRIVFSELIDPLTLTGGNIVLTSIDDAHSALLNIPTTLVNNTLDITPASILKSNSVYHLFIANSIQDLSGNLMTGHVDISFTTVDYTEPKIVLMTPPVTDPVFPGQVFRAKFNKAVDIASFDASHGGTATLVELDAFKGDPKAGGNVPLAVTADPTDPAAFNLAPQGVAINAGSFYRLTIAGVGDTQQPPVLMKAPQSFDYFAFDQVKPVVTIVSPVPQGTPLVARGGYMPTVSIADSGTNPPKASKDIKFVEWYSTDGTNKTLIAKVYAAPWGLPNFTAPDVSAPAQVTLYAKATDLSLNDSDFASYTWDVLPNLPPTNVTVTLSKPTIYLKNHVDATVAFSDEGVSCSVQLAVIGKHADGSDYPLTTGIAPGSIVVTRPVGGAWPTATFGVDLPGDLKEGDSLRFIATVTDIDSHTGTGEAATTVAIDANAPTIVSILPPPDTSYAYGNGSTSYTIQVKARDAESGVKNLTIAYPGAPANPTITQSYDAATGIWTFSHVAHVTAQNSDTRIHIVATAFDYHGNATPASVDVIYQRVDDTRIPRAQWITPVDGAALPSNKPNETTTVKLRVHATDDIKVESVTFTSPQFTAPVQPLTAPNAGTDTYEATATLTVPAEGTPFTITATIKDSDSTHDVVLPITIDPVAVDTANGDAIILGPSSIEPGSAANYSGKNVVVTGANAVLYIKAPVTLKNLIVVNGATVGDPSGTKLDVTVANHLYVDGDSSVNVTAKGYLGGWHFTEDRGQQNTSATGKTLGDTTTGGALNASASYGGVGGLHGGSTNAVYGSITAPTDLGSGGSGSGCCNTGGNGGGAVALRTTTNAGDIGRIVLAGSVLADGERGSGEPWGAGSGGSVLISARALVTGHATRITANGADDSGGPNATAGGGGGRIAITATDRLDLESGEPIVQARGGRNLNGGNIAAASDGGAGTIFLRRPASTVGDLIVSGYDESNPNSHQLNRATPLSSALGVVAFDSATAGPRALVRIDDTSIAPSAFAVDATAVVAGPNDVPTLTIDATSPAAGSAVVQGQTIVATFTAKAEHSGGVEHVDFTVAAGGNATVLGGNAGSFSPQGGAPVVVSTSAATGTTTLTVTMTDRAGRTVTAPALNFTVGPNAPPAITQFDVAPLQTYAGHTIAVSAAATDDLAVTSLSLAVPGFFPVAGQPVVNGGSTSRTFTVQIPNDAATNTTAAFTLSASDSFPGRAAVTQTTTVTILKDPNPPSITSLTAPDLVQEGTGATFTVTAAIADAEVGVKSATATFDGVNKPMAFNGTLGLWTVIFNVPNVDGTDPVAKTLTVTASDYDNNLATSSKTVSVKPLLDSNGPILNWTCGSPGAVYPAGTTVDLRVSALPPSAQNGVQTVQFTINDDPPVTAVSAGTNLYKMPTPITLPSTDGATVSVRVVATAVSGNSNAVISTIVVDATPVTFSSSTIVAANTTFDNRSLLIGSGSTMTIVGAHHFKNLVVLDGGTLVQQPADGVHADLITADRLFVACNGAINVAKLGFGRNATLAGAGIAVNGSGGGHIGRGGKWDPMSGGAFGNVYMPQEGGGGGGTTDTAAIIAGGGSVRLTGTTSAAIDGVVNADGVAANGSGAGAGGAVWITTGGRLAGGGSIEATGSAADRGAGGGGGIALEYDTKSGLLFSQLNAAGGASSSAPGGAGTIYLRGTSSVYGDLAVDAKNVANSTTELPSFGSASVASVSGKTATLDARWVAPFLAGNYVQVSTADGTPRGTWRIASVTQGPSTRTFNGTATINTQDGVAYDGFLMFSEKGYSVGGATKKFVAVRYNNAQWQYDDDTAFVSFTPDAGDRIVASFSKDTASITSFAPVACCTPISGIPALQLVGGEILANVDDATGQTPIANAAEFMIRPDADGRAVVLANEPAAVTLLDGAIPVDVRAGDKLSGVYLFDHLTASNGARVQSRDAITVSNAPTIDATSKLVGPNAGAPSIDAGKVSIVAGANGVSLVGVAGAVSDPDTPLHVVAHDTARGALPPRTFALQNASSVGVGGNGGFSLSKPFGSNAFGDSGVSSIDTIGQGYVSFSAVTGHNANAGFVVDDTTRGNNDPTQNVFHLKSNGQYEVWANGATTSSASGSYSASTNFRLEKSATAIRWFVDGRKVFETANAAPAVRFDAAFGEVGAEVNTIVFDKQNAAPAAFAAIVAADGSFSMPIDTGAGDAFTLVARDGHAYPLATSEVSVGSTPTDLGVASITLTPSTLFGGASTTATVTLGRPAPTGGAIVTLTSTNGTVAPVPATVTVTGGALSATFTINTPAVAAPVTATISATYVTTQTATLTVNHDGNGPVINISDPNANTPPYTVDSGAHIHVVATAVDAETRVGSISVLIEGGSSTPTTMTATTNPNEYAADLPIPTVSGSTTVSRNVTVTAVDAVGNTQTAVAAVRITPHFDPTAPIVTFVCGSDGAIVAPGAQLTLKVIAVPGSSGTAVSSVSFSDGTTTLSATASGSLYTATTPYTVPSSAAPGSIITILATATTNGQGTGTQQAQLTVASFDKTINGDTTIASSDTTTYDNKDVLITAGKVTIVGPHTFKKLVILGGSVIPKGVDILHPGTLTIDKLYVACGASIDATPFSGAVLGFAQNTTYPGAGAAVFDSGGGHIGRGARFNGRSFQVGVPGGTFGSIYHPLEPGGGGMVREPSAAGGTGGGVVRLVANTAVVDGSILANGQDSANNGGAGAGGSIYVTASNISGGGSIQANGAGPNATWDSGAGGGGAIAIEYSQAGGTILNNVVATGGLTNFQGAAGSAYLFGPQSTYGDLVISNGTRSSALPANVITELPSFGIAKVLSAPSGGTAVVDAMWEGTYLAGHRLQVTAPDGTPRGDWRIASIANDASVRTVNGFAAVPTQSVAYDGYLMYSDAGHPAGKHLVAVRNNGGTWQYDDGSTFTNFTPQTGDVLFASFSTSATTITTAQTFTCPNAVCAPLSGIPTAAVVRGDAAMNGASGTWLVLNGTSVATGAIVAASHSFFIHPDSDTHGFVLSSGPATVTLESGADVRAGDTVRGLYRFDHVTIKNARVYTPDLVISTNTPSVDANSTWVSGNVAAPAIDTTKISVAAGSSGPIVVGAAGALSDSDASASKPIELYIRNGARTAQTPAFQSDGGMTFGTKGGFSVFKLPNGNIRGFATTAAAVTGYAYITSRASQTTSHMDMAIGEYDLGWFSDGNWVVWINGQRATGPYTPQTQLRIEKTPTVVNFFVDGALVYSSPSDSTPRAFLLASWDDYGEINSVDYGVDTPARFNGVAAANGSFSLPIYGTAGDALTISARDRHTYPLTSASATIASIPASAVISAPVLSPNPNVGGHSVTGTVTLGSPAPAGGVTVPLSSSSTSATVPASVTIPANATSANFTITTTVVTVPTTATITASYGGVAYSTALSIVVDNIPPSITLTQPSANVHFLEGSGQISVQATVTDADAGVQSVIATLDGTNYTMTAPNGSNVYSKTITAPFIDGTVAVAKQITVTATDKAGNPNTANVSVFIDPVTDTTPPSVSWNCYANGAMFPTAYSTKLDVTVPPVSAQNIIQSVVFQFDDGSSLTAQPIGSNVYEATWTTPSAPKTSTITAVATAAGGGTKSLPITATIATADNLMTANGSISATNTLWEGKVVAISGSTTVVTIDGTHNFSKLMVLAGAKVVETSGLTNPLTLGTTTPTDIYVACNSSIDVSIAGYGANGTYPGATAPNNLNGGSHIGVGGKDTGTLGSTYGSLYFPAEAGAGGGNGGMGGGVARINAGTLTVDGSIKANGNLSDTFNNVGAAGGSLWITANTLAGSGAIQALGGNTGSWGTGGGGAISLTYSTLGSGTILSNLLARTGTGSSRGELGGAGSIWVKGPNGSYGDLTINNSGIVGQATVLPSLGSGTALSGSTGTTLVTDRALDIPAYFNGHWIEVRDAGGTLQGTWRATVSTINPKQVTLTPNGNESINVQQGYKWQGVYRFDTIFAPNGENFTSADPIRLGDANGLVNLTGPTIASGKALALVDPINATTVKVLSGNVGASSITASTVTVKSGAILSASSTALTIKAASTTVESGGSIDVSANGYPQNVSYPGAAIPNNQNGGSHIGIGGKDSGALGSTYGSVYFPAEAGSGGGNGGKGGGAVYLEISGTLQNDGSIKADGNAYQTFNNIGGAAGSVWINTQTLTGSGSVTANGGDTGSWGTGGGGAISINYSTFGTGTMLSNLSARTGLLSSRAEYGGAGSIYIKASPSALGALTVDYAGVTGQATELPSFGNGIAQSGSSGATLVTGRSSDIPQYFIGHWVEITDAAGAVRGTWRIATIPSPRTVTLAPNANESINVQPGDGWRGVYRFDTVTVKGATLQCGDRIDGTVTLSNGGKITVTSAPIVTAGKIALSSTLNADVIAGTAGAVSDPDTPIKVTVTNNRSAQTFIANAAADGSFSIPVSGVPGDTFTLVATDSAANPLSSNAVTVAGQITNTNGVALLSASPQSVAGGGIVTFGVRLLAQARYPVTVTLTSDNAAVPVPASTTVPSGTISASFSVTTVNPAAQTTATITAAGPTGAPQSTTVTVIPSTVGLVSVTLAPGSVQGGTSVNGTVTLGGPAPAGGAIVSLSSSNSAASVPALVTVLAGSTTGQFTVTTSQTGSTVSATITGVYGSAQSASLTITACSSMQSPPTPSGTTLDQVWVDDALPAGATSSGSGSFVNTQAATGTQSLNIPAAAGSRQFSFSGATTTLAVGASDRLVTYVLVNPCNPPRQILFVWSDGTTEYRASWGEDLIEPTVAHAHMGLIPTGGQWTKLETTASVIGAGGKTLRGLTIKMYGGEAWFDDIGRIVCTVPMAAAPSTFPSNEFVWFDDSLPPGALPTGQPTATWTFDTGQHASGTSSYLEPKGSGLHQHYFTGATTAMVVKPGDVLFTYVLIDPCNPPRQLLLQWNDGVGWEHRATWGEDVYTPATYGSPAWFYMGTLPEAGKWVRLEVPAELVGLENVNVSGVAFSLWDGQAWFDRVGKYSRVNLAVGKTATQSSNLDGTNVAARAIDGATAGDTASGTLAATASQTQPWWQVDLGSSQPIETITVWSPGVSAFWLYVSDNPFTANDVTSTRNQSGVSSYRFDGSISSRAAITINRTGRYVRVQLNGTGSLQLGEVQVWAPGAAERINLAGGLSTVSQSSTFSGNWFADRALDGTRDITANSVTATNQEANAWWDLDLGSSRPISSIDIYNRIDCCPDRLQAFYVFVSDNPFTSHVLADAINQAGVYVAYFGFASSPPPAGYTVPLNRTGRYIRVQLNRTEFLSLTELQVWSPAPTLAPLSTPIPTVLRTKQ